MRTKLTPRRLIAASTAALVLTSGLALAAPAADASAVGTRAAYAAAPSLGPVLTLGGTIAISGSAEVGSPLTAVPSVVASLTAAILSGTWLKDGVPIPGATGTTYTPVMADAGAQLSYRVTASLLGLADVSLSSAFVGPVTVGGSTSLPSFVLPPTAVVSGTSKVGETLVALGDAPSPVADLLAYQWLADGSPIPGATAQRLTLAADQLGKAISVRVTALKDGLLPSVITSSPTDPVAKGVVRATGTLTVSGDPRVGGSLTASLPTIDPADTAGSGVVGQWLNDGQPIVDATGTTYSPTAADLGHRLGYRVTITLPGYDALTLSSGSTAPIELGTFAVGPIASITGETKVGAILTADGGTPSPLADSLAYQWYADGVALAGATARTLLLTPDLRDSRVKVLVTAVRAGLAETTSASGETAPIGTDAAPDLTFSADHTAVPLGSSAQLSWTSGDADSLVASGGWSGPQPASGTASVRPTALGTTTYTLAATNSHGTTTMQVAVEAQPAPKIVPVSAATGSSTVSKSLRLRASGLYPGEAYTIRVSTSNVATGRASSSGNVDRTLRLARAATARHTLVKLTGSIAERTGRTDARTTNDTALSLRRSAQVRATQQITVTRLAPGEHVQLSYRGHQLLPRDARADAAGTYVAKFDVGSGTGKRKASLYGTFSHRRAATTFTVLPH